MDSALDKVGLYDFFGVFLSGMLILVISMYLHLPLKHFMDATDNEVINLILFILEGYFIGLIFQEVSSALEKKYFRFGEKARTAFLNDNDKIVDNQLELNSFRMIANEMLEVRSNNHIYSKKENEYVYYQCKSFIEMHEKSEKINRIDSLYAMSRTLMVALSVCLSAFFIYNVCSFNVQKLIIIFILGGGICLFYRRTKRYSQYKVRVILRYYKILNNK